MAKQLQTKTTEHIEQGLASAERTVSVLAFATKGKAQMGERSREKLQIDLAGEMQSGMIRWRSRSHREELGETVNGYPQGLREAAAH